MLLTSDNEGTPLSLIQAGMAGLPVVSTHVGSVGEVVENGSTGILCRTDSEELAEALSDLIFDPVGATVMGERGREFAEARFGVSRLVQDHTDLYEAILRN
jgi:glycosyltransferase involved in cell wall biosynthesis